MLSNLNENVKLNENVNLNENVKLNDNTVIEIPRYRQAINIIDIEYHNGENNWILCEKWH